MTVELITEILSDIFFTTMLLLLPILMTSLIVGVVISIFQTATSINEMTLTFVPKIILTAIVIIIFLPFILDKLVTFTVKYFNMFTALVK